MRIKILFNCGYFTVDASLERNHCSTRWHCVNEALTAEAEHKPITFSLIFSSAKRQPQEGFISLDNSLLMAEETNLFQNGGHWGGK